ncbi:YfiR family protein [Xenorhabdus innexi]|uniref:Uncharacterized protein n=1 Tax=Xenorhabdus innexi TaxID=290109 RepID=A0A1N6MVU7_9GAMM|nr:YfiR family protein [Xenorhabdus innexi]PHM37549.1 hypothetical protein Xinn_00934 [Xenorhabdus innexi]SIP72966.1 conserved hypothetical protein [Xenorhabdus innexi]
MFPDNKELRVEVINFDTEQVVDKCDNIHYGQIDPIFQYQVFSQKNNKLLLTIAEQKQYCGIASAFCLNIDSTQTIFNFNPDILTRSGIRADSNVRQLANKAE